MDDRNATLTRDGSWPPDPITDGQTSAYRTPHSIGRLGRHDKMMAGIQAPTSYTKKTHEGDHMMDDSNLVDQRCVPPFFTGGFSVPEEDWAESTPLPPVDESIIIYLERKGPRRRAGLTLCERQRISREIEEADTAYDPIADGPIRV